MQSIIIRPFQPSDQAYAKRLVLEGLSERFQPFRPELHPDLDDIQKHYDVFLVAYRANQLVATGALSFLPKDTAKVKRMSTAPAFRGQGIAGRILSELETIAKAKGVKHLTLITGQNWTDAIRFYERHGFQTVATYRDETDFRGVRLEKPLS